MVFRSALWHVWKKAALGGCKKTVCRSGLHLRGCGDSYRACHLQFFVEWQRSALSELCSESRMLPHPFLY